MPRTVAEALLQVLHDDSAVAEQALQALQLLPTELKVIPLSIVIAANTQALQALMQQHQLSSQSSASPPAFVLLITDNPSVLDGCSDYIDDVLLWPQPISLVASRIRLLQHWYWCRSELVRVRDALEWHDSRNDREHQLVEHIFRNALSRNFLDYPNIQTYLTPVSKFNGDLCLVAPGPLGNVYLLMADFTGHGLAPATGALPLSQAFFAMADRGVSIAEMVTEFNFRLNRLLPDDMFCAGLLLELSANGERITFWNGGMPPALVCDASGQIIKRLTAQHMALGVLDDDDFDSKVTTLRVPAESFVVTYTDGVIELLGSKLEFLGIEALETLLRRHPTDSEFPALVEELELFRGEQPLHDDLSLALLRCRPTELNEAKELADDRGMAFSFSTRLRVEQLQNIDPIGYVLNAVSQLPRLRAHRTTIYLLLAEAYNNALEHGLLKLDSHLKDTPDGFAQYYLLRSQRLAQLDHGEITIEVSYDDVQQQLEFTVTDSGDGFATASRGKVTAHPHGRGLDLLQQLTKQLQWQQNGRQINFIYQL
jgi:serine phosphatase RsbU (regulator of sigma subunit)